MRNRAQRGPRCSHVGVRAQGAANVAPGRPARAGGAFRPGPRGGLWRSRFKERDSGDTSRHGPGPRGGRLTRSAATAAPRRSQARPFQRPQEGAAEGLGKHGPVHMHDPALCAGCRALWGGAGWLRLGCVPCCVLPRSAHTRSRKHRSFEWHPIRIPYPPPCIPRAENRVVDLHSPHRRRIPWTPVDMSGRRRVSPVEV
jgi:hypothetical protein